MSINVYLMAIVDNYMFRPLLAVFRLSSPQARDHNPRSFGPPRNTTPIKRKEEEHASS